MIDSMLLRLVLQATKVSTKLFRSNESAYSFWRHRRARFEVHSVSIVLRVRVLHLCRTLNDCSVLAMPIGSLTTDLRTSVEGNTSLSCLLTRYSSNLSAP